MAQDGKDKRQERDSQTIVSDLLRRATSPEVLAGVAGAAAAARFTKHMVEDSDDTEAEEKPDEADEVEAAADDEPGDDQEEDDHERQEPRAGEDEPDEDEDEPDDDEEQGPEAVAEPESDADVEDDPSEDGDVEEREETSDSAAANGSAGTDDERLELLDHARRYAEQLTGHPVESFSSLEQDDRGWRIGVEVVELSRVPSTTDVLGSYELVLGDDGDFVDFRRAGRYYRNSTDDSSS